MTEAKTTGLSASGAIVLAIALFYFLGNRPADPLPSTQQIANGIYQTKITAPCAVDRDAIASMAQAVKDRDQDAIEGLEERKQIYILKEGTRFEVAGAAPVGVAWGFVRSGRYSGENCYAFAKVVQ